MIDTIFKEDVTLIAEYNYNERYDEWSPDSYYEIVEVEYKGKKISFKVKNNYWTDKAIYCVAVEYESDNPNFAEIILDVDMADILRDIKVILKNKD